ncbi:MAG TPA: hypothetical protein P5181_09510 [Dermatophilaceae bacterium]|nr:hypothetical protein [Dermatophilaceae bacterium]
MFAALSALVTVVCLVHPVCRAARGVGAAYLVGVVLMCVRSGQRSR